MQVEDGPCVRLNDERGVFRAAVRLRGILDKFSRGRESYFLLSR
jgi:hypothetical protein